MKIHGGEIRGPGGRILPLSPATEFDELVFLSGQVALKDGTVQGDITQQTQVVLDSIEALLARMDLSLDNVAKTTVWLTDPQDFAAFNAVYASRMRAPYPSRSCVVAALLVAGARVEIEAVASRRHVRA